MATFLDAFDTTLSAFRILALNSGMQTPAGYEVVDGACRAADWMAVIFNPSFPFRLAHMLLASALTASTRCNTSPPGSPRWMLVALLLLILVFVLGPAGYTVFSYRVFRGKAGELRYA